MAEKYTLGKDWIDAIIPGRRAQMSQLYESEPETMAKDNVGPRDYEYQSWEVSDNEFSEFNWLDFEKEGGYPEWLGEYAKKNKAPLSKDWMGDQFVEYEEDGKTVTPMQSYFKQKRRFVDPTPMERAEDFYQGYIKDVLREFM